MGTLMARMAALCIFSATFLAAHDATALERWLRVHNHTSYNLCYVQISHVDRNSWGPDILGNTCLSPGYYRTVNPGWQQGYCKMDMRFEFSDGDTVVEYDFNICVAEDYHIYD